MTTKGICILPSLDGVGGPISFRHRFIQGMQARGYTLEASPLSDTCGAVLLIGGTSRLDQLWRAQRKGVRIVQRLNGMNWIHRKKRLGWRYYLRSEYNNWLLAFIRRQLADSIVYQSEFARSWWQTVHGMAPATNRVVYNGVDLDVYTPHGEGAPPEDHVRLLLVEAHVGGGYEKGLENAIRMAQILTVQLTRPVELMVVGNVAKELRDYWDQNSGIWLNWQGVAPRERIPVIDRSAHLLFSSDLNAACPNSVIEALACGLPVIGYATGSLPELLDDDAGRVVPYGSNYWNLEPPDVQVLVNAALDVLNNLDHFRTAARRKAEAAFSASRMVDGYLQELVGRQ